MANKKISELPVVTTLENTDVLPLVNSDGTKKVTISSFMAKIKSFFSLPDNMTTSLAEKVNTTENSLTTTSKLVVGAINEINGNRYTKTQVDDLLDDKADIDGYYEGLAVGTADNLIDRKGSGTSQEFTFRTSCGSSSIADDGTGEVKSLHGNTIVWNQLIQNGNFADTSGWTNEGTFSVSNNVATFTATGQWSSLRRAVTYPANHKYLSYAQIKNTTSNTLIRLQARTTGNSNYYVLTSAGTDWQELSNIFTPTLDISMFMIQDARSSGFDAIQIRNCMLIDLTQMFGSGNEPSTVAEFKALFPLDYYAYDTGSLLSFNGTGIKTDGFNQWDEEWEVGIYDNITGEKLTESSHIRSKNYIPVFPNTQYALGSNAVNGKRWRWYEYDANKNFLRYGDFASIIFTTGDNCRYINFTMSTDYGTTYNNDICINLSWSGYRNGEYEAYWSRTLALPVSTYFSDGMKSAGSVYDELTANKAIKRIGKVDLGTLTWEFVSSYGSKSETIFRANLPSDSKTEQISGTVSLPNINISKYTVVNPNWQFDNNSYGTASWWYTAPNQKILIRDSNYTDATAFKTAMSGVYLYYELAETEETTIDPPLNLAYKVADFGTEMLLPENDDEPTTSLLNAIIAYTDDFTRMLATLPKNYDTTDGLDALTSALATMLGTALNGTVTITRGAYDATNKKYAWTCTFTANS